MVIWNKLLDKSLPHLISVATLPCELDVELTLLWSCWKEKCRIHSTCTVASKFVGFKSSWVGVWGMLQEKMYKIHMTDFDDLKHRIRTEWAKLDHAVIAAAVHEWRCHLSACVKAGDGHFEHWFWFRLCLCSNNCDLACCRWPVEQLHANRPVWCDCSCQFMTLCFVIHIDCLIYQVKYTAIYLNLLKLCQKDCQSSFSWTRYIICC